MRRLLSIGLNVLTILQFDKGGKFLRKLWCCVGRRVEQGYLVLSTQLIT